MANRTVFLEYDEGTDAFPLGTYTVRVNGNNSGNNFSAISVGSNYLLYHGNYDPKTKMMHGQPLATMGLTKKRLAHSTLYSVARGFGERSADSLDTKLVDKTPHGNRDKPGQESGSTV